MTISEDIRSILTPAVCPPDVAAQVVALAVALEEEAAGTQAVLESVRKGRDELVRLVQERGTTDAEESRNRGQALAALADEVQRLLAGVFQVQQRTTALALAEVDNLFLNDAAE